MADEEFEEVPDSGMPFGEEDVATEKEPEPAAAVNAAPAAAANNNSSKNASAINAANNNSSKNVSATPPEEEVAEEAAAPVAAAETKAAAEPKAAAKARTEKQQEMQKKRDEKLAELRSVYAERFADIPEKERPKAKAYYAVALIAAADPAAKLEEIIAKERKEYEDKKAGIKKPRKTRKAATEAPAAEEPVSTNETDAPAAAVAPPLKTGRKTKRVSFSAKKLREAAAAAERDLMEAAAASKESLMGLATNADEKAAATKLAAEAKSAARSLVAAAKETAKELEEAVAVDYESLKAQAAENLKASYGSKPIPPGMAKGLAKVRAKGYNMTVKNYKNVCKRCTKRKDKKGHK